MLTIEFLLLIDPQHLCKDLRDLNPSKPRIVEDDIAGLRKPHLVLVPRLFLLIEITKFQGIWLIGNIGALKHHLHDITHHLVLLILPHSRGVRRS